MSERLIEVLQAKLEIEKEGGKVTNKSIADRLGITRQRVNMILRAQSVPSKFNHHEVDVEKFKDVDTSEMTLIEIKKFIRFAGAVSSLRRQLKSANIPFKDSRSLITHKNSLKSKVLALGVDTSQYTIVQLHEMIACKSSVNVLRIICSRAKIPFKKL